MDTDPITGDIRALLWRRDTLWLLDQRRLPIEEHWLELRSVAEVVRAIRDMAIRGAPAIGIAAAYGVALGARQRADASGQSLRAEIEEDMSQLAAARPTAVNLAWALERMRRRLTGRDRVEAAELLVEARAIHEEDVARNRLMAQLGAECLAPGSRVLTHCNTGSLATGGHGTALGVIRTAWRGGRLAGIWATETRPWLQGARLTAWELARDRIPATLIADSAAALLMREGLEWVIVGADRIAANGDVANKIGTYGLAVLARAHGVKFMVVAPSSTVDMATRRGADIPIEERDAQELWRFGEAAMPRPGGIGIRNPVFDVTPADLVSTLVTERGIIENPGPEKMAEVFETAK